VHDVACATCHCRRRYARWRIWSRSVTDSAVSCSTRPASVASARMCSPIRISRSWMASRYASASSRRRARSAWTAAPRWKNHATTLYRAALRHAGMRCGCRVQPAHSHWRTAASCFDASASSVALRAPIAAAVWSSMAFASARCVAC